MIDRLFCLCNRSFDVHSSAHRILSTARTAREQRYSGDPDAIHQRVCFCKIYKFLYCKSHYLLCSSSQIDRRVFRCETSISCSAWNTAWRLYRNVEYLDQYHDALCTYRLICTAISAVLQCYLTGAGHCATGIVWPLFNKAWTMLLQIRNKFGKLFNYLAHWTWFLCYTTTNEPIQAAFDNLWISYTRSSSIHTSTFDHH